MLDRGKHLAHAFFRRGVPHILRENLVDHRGSACACFIRHAVDFLHDFVRKDKRIHAFVHLYHLLSDSFIIATCVNFAIVIINSAYDFAILSRFDYTEFAML